MFNKSRHDEIMDRPGHFVAGLTFLIFEISEEQPFFNARVVVFNLAVESWEKLLLY